MARDYKSRIEDRSAVRHKQAVIPKSKFGIIRWMLVTALAIAFAVFLVYLKGLITNKAGAEAVATTQKEVAAKQEQESGPKPPQFDFYTILPKKEVVVPEYEIKTRSREERVGHGKETSYLVQAGSYNTLEEADALRIRLALMGFASKIQKAKVGDVSWFRVKMGPYTQTASVATIRNRLRRSGIDVIVTETGED